MNRKKILVVDDDPAICEGMEMILEDAGYEVVMADEKKTVTTVHKYLPNLILLDIWMAGIDGRDICKQLKTQEQTKHIPIILVSANKDTEQIAKAAGANGFLAKPFEIKDLLTVVSKYAH